MSKTKSTIAEIYTDGACSGNPGPGGWGALLHYANGAIWELGGGATETTNNRMELQAAIAALEFLQEHPQTAAITLHTDSEYVKKGITQWVSGWKKKSWKTSQGKPVLNRDLWEQLDCLNSPQILWQYVRGHSGNWGNERCDEIARGFTVGPTPQLRQDPSISQLDTQDTAGNRYPTLQSACVEERATMKDNLATVSEDAIQLPRSERVNQLRNLIDTLRIADEIASKGYLIGSAELADLMDVNASAVTSRGDRWAWRNWIVSRVRREGNQILWQLERVD
ncbi:MAG: ribonuclease HI [Cyanobacteria bacterium J06641_5]